MKSKNIPDPCWCLNRELHKAAPCFLVYKENHSLGEWFKRAYGDKDGKAPAIMGMQSANRTNKIVGGTFMSMNDIHSLSHTKWNFEYHIVFAPKYRRQVFYRQKKEAVGKVRRQLCEWKGVNHRSRRQAGRTVKNRFTQPVYGRLRASLAYLAGRTYAFDASAKNKGARPHSDNHRRSRWLCFYFRFLGQRRIMSYARFRPSAVVHRRQGLESGLSYPGRSVQPSLGAEM